MLKTVLIISCLLGVFRVAAQDLRGDSWKSVLAGKKGTVTALWDEIEPFIYTNDSQQLRGVEFEIMESLKPYLKSTYGVDLTIQWQKAGSFDSIYYKIRTAHQPGLFGWSYYSITPARSREVSFSPAYMPDLNVLITNNREPMYATPQEFTSRLKEMHAYTQSKTTMEEDVMSLKKNFYPEMPVTMLPQDYDIIRRIEEDEQAFGYIPLSIYIVALQKGHKVKRQTILASRREGFAAVMPPESDWAPVMREYFSSPLFRHKAGAIVAKYLGSKVRDLVFVPVTAGADEDSTAGIELVSLEKEIVTKRLMDTAVEAQRHRSFQYVVIVIAVALLIVILVLYSRYRTRRLMNKQLQEQNQEISLQRDQIASMNQLLQLKILQSRLNPHFLFNSLNSIQYFVMGDDKKVTLTYISRFSSFLRKMIRHGDEVHISAADEKEVLAEYLWLEQSRFRDKFEYAVSFSGNIAEARILPLISVSLAENIIYQRIIPAAKNGKTMLRISFDYDGNNLKMIVHYNALQNLQDNNRAIYSLIRDNTDSISQRIDLFNSQATENITLKPEEDADAGCTKIILTVPQTSFKFPEPVHSEDQTLSK